MIWEEPEHYVNSFILAYRVDCHKPGDERWTVATYSNDECALIKGLLPDVIYRFRVCAINKFAISPYSWASVEIRTRKKGAESIDIDFVMKRILLRFRQVGLHLKVHRHAVHTDLRMISMRLMMTRKKIAS
jgi:hypothetical protein